MRSWFKRISSVNRGILQLLGVLTSYWRSCVLILPLIVKPVLLTGAREWTVSDWPEMAWLTLYGRLELNLVSELDWYVWKLKEQRALALSLSLSLSLPSSLFFLLFPLSFFSFPFHSSSPSSVPSSPSPFSLLTSHSLPLSLTLFLSISSFSPSLSFSL